jgi:hypothetical protein
LVRAGSPSALLHWWPPTWVPLGLLLLTALLLGVLVVSLCKPTHVTLSDAPRSQALYALHARPLVAATPSRPLRNSSFSAGVGVGVSSSVAGGGSFGGPAQASPVLERSQFRQGLGGLQHKRALSRSSLLSDA